ncbi:MAG: hypothetical protein EBT84_11580 [Sphingomonadaceae bacterium]|nr:hypothetical protein [Sphingomonadaceae bacterium]
MAKKKPNKPKDKVIKKAKVVSAGLYSGDKCANDEQAEAALVYAVRSFNKYFKEGLIVAKVAEDKYKVVTFGPGSPKEHFKPVMWSSIKAAYEAFKEGINDDEIFDG